MSKYDGKYFQLSKGIIHIKETHPQISTAVCLVEIDDWAGDIFRDISNTFYLNNKNLMAEVSDFRMVTFLETTKDEFAKELKKQISSFIDEIKRGNSWARVDFKQTDERTRIFRKHYGTKP